MRHPWRFERVGVGQFQVVLISLSLSLYNHQLSDRSGSNRSSGGSNTSNRSISQLSQFRLLITVYNAVICSLFIMFWFCLLGWEYFKI